MCVLAATVVYLVVHCCSPKREARLLNIIQELKTYKKLLSAKIDETKRHADINVSPLHDILQNGMLLIPTTSLIFAKLTMRILYVTTE